MIHWIKCYGFLRDAVNTEKKEQQTQLLSCIIATEWQRSWYDSIHVHWDGLKLA